MLGKSTALPISVVTELEPARTRVLLARLSPWKRHYVIDNFTCNTSGSIVAALETYIESCDKNNLWASSAPQRQASASEVATPPRRTVPSVVKPPKARDRSRSRDAARKDAEQARRTSQPHGTEGNEASLIREQPVNAQGKANAVARSKAAANQKNCHGHTAGTNTVCASGLSPDSTTKWCCRPAWRADQDAVVSPVISHHHIVNRTELGV